MPNQLLDGFMPLTPNASNEGQFDSSFEVANTLLSDVLATGISLRHWYCHAMQQLWC